MSVDLSPSGMFGIVETYCSFGAHHTGTDADAQTADWLERLLVQLGAETSRHRYTFLRWFGTAHLSDAAGDTVPCEPIFYSASGQYRDLPTEVVTEAQPGAVGNAAGLVRTLAHAPSASALAVAIDGPFDEPVQANQIPRAVDGRPAVIIPANRADQVRHDARLRFVGNIETASSSTIVAALGPVGAPPVAVTTPLTGWFECAGERGTGLAVALALAHELAADHRVHFTACSGHELDHQGLRAWLETADPMPGGRVIHLGASVAACEPSASGGLELADSRLTITTVVDPAARRAIESAVAAGRFSLADPDPWRGEGATWREAGAEVLSFLGATSLFHTAADTPAAATTASALASATDAVIAATRMFLDAASERARQT